MIRVVLADDHGMFREGLKRIISDATGFEIVAEAADGNELIRKVRDTVCDVIVLDISMPNRTGLEALMQLRHEDVSTPVLILSMHSESQYAVRAFRSGAAGYLTKESAPGELIDALRSLASGRKYVTMKAAEWLAGYVEGSDARKDQLSEREHQVMILIASGLTITEISDQLSLSVSTISTYRARVLEKLGLKNSAEITLWAVREGFLD